MTGFWNAPTGNKITGTPDKAFLQDFTTIPDGTMALASIKSFMIIDAPETQYKAAQKYIEVVYKLIDGDFKNRQVTQKIKPFDGKPESVERNLNMLLLVMNLCGFKPTHNNEPSNDELASMNGKVVGVKILEWSMPKNDGSGIMEGNFVGEVYASTGFVCETGIKMEVVHAPVQTAFDRNPRGGVDVLEDDIPF